MKTMKTYVNPLLEISAISLQDVLTLSGNGDLPNLRVNEGDAEIGAHGTIGADFWN